MFFKQFPWNQPSFLWPEPVCPPLALILCGPWLSSGVSAVEITQCHLRQGQQFRLWLTSCSAQTSGAGGAERCSDLSGHTYTQLSSEDMDSTHQDTVSFSKEGNPSSWPLYDLEIDGAQSSATFNPRIFGNCPETDLPLGGQVCECQFPLENTSYKAKIKNLESIHRSSIYSDNTPVFFFLFAFSILKTHAP